MIVTLADDAVDSGSAKRFLAEYGLTDVVPATIGGRRVLLVEGGDEELAERLRALPAVRSVLLPTSGNPLAERQSPGADSIVSVGGIPIGGDAFTMIAGPCAVESREQLRDSAALARSAGTVILRGGAYKPRTSPYAFQGIAAEGLALLAEVGREYGMPVVTEVVDVRDVELVAAHADMLQIGARNAQNFTLLTEAGRTGRPVLLKRGFGCTVAEWLGAAEYVLRTGNPNVVLCERGIRTFENATRFTLDLAVIPVLENLSHLPVIVDPSHGTGDPALVAPMALAAAAAGADGLLVDVHFDPANALCDGAQALEANDFELMMKRLEALLAGLDRPIARRELEVAP